MLDSLVCSIDVYDLVKLASRKDKRINVKMRGRGSESILPSENNAYKAAERYRDAFQTCGADIEIYKNIPLGAGLGGSSADAAGVLRGMCELYSAGSESEIKDIADSLGSDTGYMLTGGFARLTGRGDKVEPLSSEMQLYGLMLKPSGGVSTAECYARYDKMPAKSNKSGARAALESGDGAALGANLFNELYPSATLINPDVARAYRELKDFAPLGVNMTGSGSGVYALFESLELAQYARSRYRGAFECITFKSVQP